MFSKAAGYQSRGFGQREIVLGVFPSNETGERIMSIVTFVTDII